RDSVQLETAVNTITYEYLLEFTSEYGITEMLRPELPGPGDRIVDFPEGKVGVYTRDEFIQLDTCPQSNKGEDRESSACSSRAPASNPDRFSESRKRGPEGVDANAPPKSLRRDHTDHPSGVPADVSDPDPLAFAGAPSHPPVDVAQSSQGIAVAKDPGFEHASSPIEVGSPGSVYRPEWG
nr:hypothetical protein [Tanacetum cinerariifolium]